MYHAVYTLAGNQHLFSLVSGILADVFGVLPGHVHAQRTGNRNVVWIEQAQ